MKSPGFAATLPLLFTAFIASAAPKAPPTPLLLTGARVLDSAGDRLLDGQDVLIEGGLLSRIAEAGTLQIPAGTQRLDFAGLTLVPGLIDLHSHLLLSPYDETPWDDQVLKEPLELRTIRGVVAVKATLEAGFTTVRDLGTESAGFADAALQDAIASGMIPGPRVFTSTRLVAVKGNPLEDVSVLETPVLVVKDGRVAVDRR